MRVVSMAAAVLLMPALLGGCGFAAGRVHSDDGVSSDGSEASGGVSDEGSRSRLADSFSSFVDMMLEQARADGTVAAEQMTVLESAKAEGVVSVAEYEQVWSNYRQCMVDKGNPEPVLVKYPNGLYHQAVVSGDASSADAFLADVSECSVTHTMYVEAVYEAQLDNPNLYEDSATGIVDCLHRHDLVDHDYTVERFSKESAEQEFSFDISDMEVLSCMVANGLFYANTDVMPKQVL